MVSNEKASFLCLTKQVEVNRRIFVTSKSVVAGFPRFACVRGSFRSSAFGEDTVGIVERYNFLKRRQIEMVHAWAFQRLVDLPGRFFLGPSHDVRYYEGLFAIAILDGFP